MLESESPTQRTPRWVDHPPYFRDHGWIFASFVRKGRMPIWTAEHFQRITRPIVEKVIGKMSAPLGWHTFRRSLASILVNNGENVKVVQDQLRHANVRVTLELFAQSMREEQRAAHSRVVEMVLPKTRQK
jgi:integrase